MRFVPGPGHPDVSASDWEQFKANASPFLISEIIVRKSSNLPDWYVPLARGVAVASDYLLERAGHRPGKYRPRYWRRTGRTVYEQDLERGGLVIRKFGALWAPGADGKGPQQVLVHSFGSTPIAARTMQGAMRLAEFCALNGLQSSLRWTKIFPSDLDGAIEFARNRR